MAKQLDHLSALLLCYHRALVGLHAHEFLEPLPALVAIATIYKSHLSGQPAHLLILLTLTLYESCFGATRPTCQHAGANLCSTN